MNEEKTQIATAIAAETGISGVEILEDGGNATLEQDLQKAMETNPDFAEQVRALQKELFEQHVKESREKHIAFVRHHMGLEYEPKFSDAIGDQTYVVSFFFPYKTGKQQYVAIPPVKMNGTVENLSPGKAYACNGYEARMVERVLAAKRIEVLNLSFKENTLSNDVAWICHNWSLLNNKKVKARPHPFGNYREPAVEALTTESAEHKNPVDPENKEGDADPGYVDQGVQQGVQQ